MTGLMKRKARSIVQNNLEYLDETVKAAIINLMEDEDIESDNEFIMALQQIYET